ncbi:hypothetical protein BB561_004086 [Smittium simulii]|uniref:Uncharacterized protein n=1 Tax=Smittium simulii TaxID=133385 RepID=A0A2T9YDZ9_9FUNG|nr:hypothetical protein BB561_004810 [Smittium simulii]PVU92020.1 hypothetical protein BB561_004086 [Smittium simulii]
MSQQRSRIATTHTLESELQWACISEEARKELIYGSAKFCGMNYNPSLINKNALLVVKKMNSAMYGIQSMLVNLARPMYQDLEHNLMIREIIADIAAHITQLRIEHMDMLVVAKKAEKRSAVRNITQNRKPLQQRQQYTFQGSSSLTSAAAELQEADSYANSGTKNHTQSSQTNFCERGRGRGKPEISAKQLIPESLESFLGEKIYLILLRQTKTASLKSKQDAVRGSIYSIRKKAIEEELKPVLDLRRLNQQVKERNFKMETLQKICPHIPHQNFVPSIGIGEITENKDLETKRAEISNKLKEFSNYSSTNDNAFRNELSTSDQKFTQLFPRLHDSRKKCLNIQLKIVGKFVLLPTIESDNTSNQKGKPGENNADNHKFFLEDGNMVFGPTGTVYSTATAFTSNHSDFVPKKQKVTLHGK